MTGPTATLQVTDAGVAVITLQNPPVNALHPSGQACSWSDVRQRNTGGYSDPNFWLSQSFGACSRTFARRMPLLRSRPSSSLAPRTVSPRALISTSLHRALAWTTRSMIASASLWRVVPSQQWQPSKAWHLVAVWKLLCPAMPVWLRLEPSLVCQSCPLVSLDYLVQGHAPAEHASLDMLMISFSLAANHA